MFRTALKVLLITGVSTTSAFLAAAALTLAMGLPSQTATLLTAGAVAATSAVSLYKQISKELDRHEAALKEAERPPAERLRELNDEVAASMANTADAMDRLVRELESQKAVAEATIAEGEERARWLEINKDEAEKMRQLLVGETKAALRAEGRKQWWFFALGLLGSIPIGIMINLFVPGN
ncbi:hypothetical protein ACFMQL_20415 [Nonomuraea fastidiosa]|uniref:hypothetical protein n=1 Tax=Nonomuraea fastidiosa TaxID=46173 RepID=UPI003672782D